MVAGVALLLILSAPIGFVVVVCAVFVLKPKCLSFEGEHVL